MSREHERDSDLIPVVGLVNYVNRNLFQKRHPNDELPLNYALFQENAFYLGLYNVALAALATPIVIAGMNCLENLLK